MVAEAEAEIDWEAEVGVGVWAIKTAETRGGGLALLGGIT